jgi:hypothetical protein
MAGFSWYFSGIQCFPAVLVWLHSGARLSKTRWWTVATLVLGGLLTILGGASQAAYQSYLDTKQKDREDRLQKLIEEQQFQRDSLLQLQETAGKIYVASAEVNRANPLRGNADFNSETEAHARARVALLDLFQKAQVYSVRVLDKGVRDLFTKLDKQVAAITYPMLRHKSRRLMEEMLKGLYELNEYVGSVLRAQFLQVSSDSPQMITIPIRSVGVQ